jgi:hypothetical protein
VGSPHTRGDGPERTQASKKLLQFSPHAWGWSATVARGDRRPVVLPTRVGMVRLSAPLVSTAARSPHTRGDGPQKQFFHGCLSSFSPHAWGWSERLGVRPVSGYVLPTRVGMVRGRCGWLARCAPFSPHAWGWSVVFSVQAQNQGVLPTRVGMVRDKPGPSPPLYVVTTLCAACPISSVCGQATGLLSKATISTT